MKCVKNIQTKKLARVPNSEAYSLVKRGSHIYAPKKDWKAENRKEAKP